MENFSNLVCEYVPQLILVPYKVPFSGYLIPQTRFSDHASFWNYGYPALMLTDTAMFRNPYYHTCMIGMKPLIAPRVHTPKFASRWFHVVVSPLIPRGLPRGSSFQFHSERNQGCNQLYTDSLTGFVPTSRSAYKMLSLSSFAPYSNRPPPTRLKVERSRL
jgi:hypothetical protein